MNHNIYEQRDGSLYWEPSLCSAQSPTQNPQIVFICDLGVGDDHQTVGGDGNGLARALRIVNPKSRTVSSNQTICERNENISFLA